MANDKNIPEVLHNALNLDGSPGSIKKFYAEWAENYDRDTAGLQYSAVEHVIDILQNCPPSDLLSVSPGDRGLRVMDAGCGTGLLAKGLFALGYKNIDGFDISEDMTNLAGDLGIYNQLYPHVDLNREINTDWIDCYDCTVSIGVFTPGHVSPEALSRLAFITRSGGLIIVSTRIAYYESESYQAVSDRLESEGKIKLIHTVKNASYTDDSNAHYWVYVVLSN
jgi:SAM-dependent methyltransferase